MKSENINDFPILDSTNCQILSTRTFTTGAYEAGLDVGGTQTLARGMGRQVQPVFTHIDAHVDCSIGGELELERSTGEGTCFHLILPAGQPGR